MGNSQLGFGFRNPQRRREPRRGRPAKHERVPHLPREVKARYPLHVTLRMLPHVWRLRSRRCHSVLERAFYAGCDRFDTRIVHYSVQHNHVHLVAETADARALARGIQGLAIRMAKGLNGVMHRDGQVFGDRYHARPLRTPTEVARRWSTSMATLASTRRDSASATRRAGPTRTARRAGSTAGRSGSSARRVTRRSRVRGSG